LKLLSSICGILFAILLGNDSSSASPTAERGQVLENGISGKWESAKKSVADNLTFQDLATSSNLYRIRWPGKITAGYVSNERVFFWQETRH
jgi:hypothetical protein